MFIDDLSDIAGSRVVFCVQTNSMHKALMLACRATWRDEAMSKAYDIAYVDYTAVPHLSFFEILSHVREVCGSAIIVSNFDDLFFTELNLPLVEDLLQSLQEGEVTSVKIDGRPPGDRSKIVFRSGNLILAEPVQKSVNSTVLAAFTEQALDEIIGAGIKTPWEYEASAIGLTEQLVNINRICVYKNLVVKGKLDLLMIAQVNELRIGLRRTFWRFFRNLPVVLTVVRAARRWLR